MVSASCSVASAVGEEEAGGGEERREATWDAAWDFCLLRQVRYPGRVMGNELRGNSHLFYSRLRSNCLYQSVNNS